MNAKAARLCRRVNRALGTLEKNRAGATKPHKVPRKVKRHWAGLDHRARGRMSRYWIGATPHKPAVKPDTSGLYDYNTGRFPSDVTEEPAS
jgi:hypothetical protein